MSHTHRLLGPIGIAGIVAVTASALLAAQLAWAHPADMYFHVHTVHVGPDGMRLTWSVAPGPMLAYSVWNEADSNQDGNVSPEEALAWAQPNLLEATLDNTTPLAWALESVEWPAALADFEAGDQPILIYLTSTWPTPLTGNHHLSLYNRFQETRSASWFYLYGDSGTAFHTPEQRNGLLQFDFMVPESVTTGNEPATAPETGLLDYWDSGTPSLAGQTSQGAQLPPDRRTSSTLARLVRTHDLSLNFYLTALAVAVGLGALHALTPGHGKTLVGAYLVGSRGTVRHAMALGSIVTLTHTGSVLVFGLLTLAASRVIMPSTLFPLLEIGSGVLVVGLGVSLIRRRWRGLQAVRAARRRRHVRKPSPGGAHVIRINQAIPVKVYNDVLPGAPVSVGSVKWRSLLALGISGGIIPCPDAIAILLVAVAINRIVLGLSLIVAFSLGLALVLTSIGIAIVRSRRLLEGLNALDRVVPAIPVFSAVVVVGLGLGLTFNAVKNTRLWIAPSSAAESSGLMAVNPDRSAATEKPLLRPVAPFQIDQANILYENIDENHSLQLAIVALFTGSVTPLTQEPFGVWDYAVSPDLTTIIYTTPREAGGSDIWAIQADGSHRHQLLACPDVACTRVAWSPDGQQLVYERRNNSPTAPIGPPSVWRLDPSTGDTAPIFQDNQLPSYDAQWSFDGQWLSYMAPGNLSVQVRNLVDGRVRSVPSQTGGSVVWSPIADVLLMTDVRFQNGQGYTHLLRLDLESGQLIDLTGDGTAGDSWASWSPQGEWVAVVRTEYGTSQISMGDQLWIMRSDGSEAHPVTDDPNVIHGLPIWSPDGKYLLVQQYSLSAASAQSELWLLNVETQERQKLKVGGSSPTWLY